MLLPWGQVLPLERRGVMLSPHVDHQQIGNKKFLVPVLNLKLIFFIDQHSELVC